MNISTTPKNPSQHKWADGLTLRRFEDLQAENEKTVEKMIKLSEDYNAKVVKEEGKTAEELVVESAGKVDPQRHLQDKVEELMSANILQCLGTMLNTVVF